MSRYRFLPALRRCCLALVALPLLASAQATSRIGASVEVGTKGNEPLMGYANDGTLYISALQYLYRSTDGGLTWTLLPGPMLAGTVLASDSSIWISPEGRLYFSFDYPYAGTTAACTSDDKGTTFSCANAALPGVTDRMWVFAPTKNDAYLTTNEGLYQTTMAVTHDGGTTWTPFQFGGEPAQPQTGPLLAVPGSANLLQAIKLDKQSFYVYSETNTPLVPVTETRPSDLGNTNAILSTSLSADNKLFIVGEETNPAGGKQLVPAYSPDEAKTWKRLPAIPQTTTGSATFSWIAAGKAGHVGVIYFYTPSGVDPTTTVDAVWSAMYAETFNALDATPTWQTYVLDENIHAGSICAAADCMGNARFAGDFINVVIDPTGAAQLTWMIEDESGKAHVRYARVAPQVSGGSSSSSSSSSSGGSTSSGSSSGSQSSSSSGGSTPGIQPATPPQAATLSTQAEGRFGGGAMGASLLLALLGVGGLRRRTQVQPRST